MATFVRRFPVIVGVLTVATVALAALRPEVGGAQPSRPEAYRVEPDVVWRDAGGETLTLDAYVPTSRRRHAAVVLVHGGAFVGGDKSDVAEQGHQLAAAGYLAIAVDYRLAPAHPYPAGLEDVQAAVAWLREPEQRAAYRVDPRRIGMLGASAGGNLATMAGTAGSGSRVTGARVSVVVSWSGLTDLNGFTQSDFGLEYLGCAARACPLRAADASPVAHVDPSDPPTLLVNASDDPITPTTQVTTMAAALDAAGVSHDELVVPGTAHATVLAPDVWETTLAYLDRHLGGR